MEKDETKQHGAAQVFKDGHTALLTTQLQTPVEDESTFQYSYKPPRGPGVREKGKSMYIFNKINF